MIKRKPGMLDLYDESAGWRIVASLGGDAALTEEQRQSASKMSWNFRFWPDDELHELISRNTAGKDALMAQAELRRREKWDGPVRWSLGVSILAVMISAVALIRSF